MLGAVFFFFSEPESRPNAKGTETRNKVFIKQSLVQSSGVHRELQRDANVGDRSSNFLTFASSHE